MEKLERSPRRNEIYGYIVGKKNNGGASRPEIARSFGMTENNADHHLKVLLDFKMIVRLREGENGSRILYYPSGL